MRTRTWRRRRWREGWCWWGAATPLCYTTTCFPPTSLLACSAKSMMLRDTAWFGAENLESRLQTFGEIPLSLCCTAESRVTAVPLLPSSRGLTSWHSARATSGVWRGHMGGRAGLHACASCPLQEQHPGSALTLLGNGSYWGG